MEPVHFSPSPLMSEQAVVHIPSASHPGQGHQTALHRAASVGNSDAVAALIQGGCAVDLQDRGGNTALHEVSWHGFSNCVKLLVKAGADVNIRNKAGNTALHLACQNAHAQSARILLLGGSAPHAKNNVGDTCLHVAARYNNLSLVKILLSSLCPVTDINQVGDTALHVAAALNHKRTVQLLLEAGTDGTVRNNAGKTALDKARDNNHKDVALLLARAPQVHRFMRGRTRRKRRERLTAGRRTQSVTRLEIQPNKDSSSVVEESPSSDQTDRRTPAACLRAPKKQQHHYFENPVLMSSSHSPDKRRRRVKEQVLNEDFLKKDKNGSHNAKDRSVQNGKAYQLYTLYRDRSGNIRQAPANGCHCKPLLKKLEDQMKVTQEEMKLDILNIQEQVNRRLSKMDRRSRHQMKVLDMLNQERAAADRRKMIYSIEQRLAQGREETLRSQVAVSHELKRWCMSLLKDMNTPKKAQYYKLLPSPSEERSGADADLESLPLLSVVSGDSSTSLATYVNIVPSESSGHNLGGLGQEQLRGRTYFEMRVDRSPDDYENTAVFSLHAENTSGLTSVDHLWQPRTVQNSSMAAGVTRRVDGFSSSSSCSSSSSHYSVDDQGPSLLQHQEYSFGRQYVKHSGEMVNGFRHARIYNEGARTLEFFTDPPSEPSFSQERNNLHAKEVTQRFFETVSTQLECWYERKIAAVEREAELRSQKDKEELLQQISILEEELKKLKTNENAEK